MYFFFLFSFKEQFEEAEAMCQAAIKNWVESSGLNMNHSMALVKPGQWDEGKLFC